MLRQWILFILAIGCTLGTLAQGQPELYPVKQNGLWGFIDRNGRIIIGPEYDLVEPFGARQFARAKKGSKVTVINRAGVGLKGLDFEDLEVIDDSTIAISVNNRWGAATINGKVLIEPAYQRVKGTGSKAYFHAQLAGRWGLVSRSGQNLVPFQFDSVGYNGAVFVARKDSGFGIFSLEGRQLTRPVYREVRVAGQLVFYRDLEDRWAAMDASGTAFLSAEWSDFRPILPYFIELKRDDEEAALYLVLSNKIILDSGYTGFSAIWPNKSDGYLQPVGNGGISVVDSSGRLIISPGYDEIIYPGPFFYVRKDKTWGLVDRNGNMIASPEFNTIDDFQDEVALIRKGSNWGVINTRGKVIIPVSYDEVSISSGTATCRAGKSVTLYELSDKGEVLSSEDYTNVRTIRVTQRDENIARSSNNVTTRNNGRPEGWFYFEKERKWGVKDSSNRIIIGPKFTKVSHYPDYGVTLVEITLPEYGSFTIGGGYIYFNKLYGLVNNTTFRYELNPSYVLIDMNGLAEGKTGYIRVVMGNGKYGVAYPDGRVISGYSYIGVRSGPYTRFLKNGRLVVKAANAPRTAIMSRDEYVRRLSGRFKPTPNSRLSLSEYHILPEGGNWGYLDSAGQEVISPQYDFASDFENERAITIAGKKWGVINPRNEPVVKHVYSYISYVPGTGKQFFQLELDSARSGFVHYQGRQIMQPKYMTLGDFHEGFASIRSGRNYNFTDLDGHTLNDKKYRAVKPFSEGLAGVRVGGFWHYLNTAGEEVIKTRYSRCGDFHQGLAWFYKDGKYGFMDTEGKTFIAPKYDKASDFNEYGLCIVRKKKKYGLINTDGEEVTGMRFGSIAPYSEGLAIARLNGGFAFLDSTGKIVETVRGYNRIGNFRDGVAWVLKNGQYGFIDREGKSLIKTRHPVCTDFGDGVCIRGYKGQQGIMDKSGQLLVKKGLTVIGAFENGLALAKNSDQSFYYFIDRNGKYRYGPYENAHPFQQGVARVREGGKWGLIDTNGLFVVSPVYDGMNAVSDDYLVTRQNGVYGLATIDGKIIASPEYSIIRYDARHDIFRLELENSVGYLRPEGTWLWPMQE